MRIVAIITACLVAVATADAVVLCQKKSGVVTVRPDACRKKETPVDVAALGLVGPAGPARATGAAGPAGPPGTSVRAWAHVDNDGPTILAGQGITSVTMPETGVYCLVPADGIDTQSAAVGVSVDYYYSSGFANYAQVSIPPATCAPGTFEVWTFGTSGESSDASFVFVAY